MLQVNPQTSILNNIIIQSLRKGLSDLYTVILIYLDALVRIFMEGIIMAGNIDSVGFIMAGKNKNMVKFPKNRQILPAIIKRTKVLLVLF